MAAPSKIRGGRFTAPPLPRREYPKLLYHPVTGKMFQVSTPEEEASLGPEWGAPQPDVCYPAAAKQKAGSFEAPKPILHPINERIETMSDYQEFPKALYHPKTKELVVVASAEDEADQLEEWGISPAPQIPLGEKPTGESAA